VLGWMDWALFVLVVVGLALRAWFGMRALRRLAPERLEVMRPRLWLRAIASQWALVALLVSLWLARHRSFVGLGLAPRPSWGLGGIALGVAMAWLLLRSQLSQLGSRPETVEKLRRRLAPVKALMPSTRAQWPGFVALCVTAGVCEELLFRGFVTWLLAHLVGSFALVALAQAALFGLAHGYQGWRGVLLTGMVGAFMAALVWVSGSLWGAMLVHALMDLHAGQLALRAAELPVGAGRDAPA